MRTASARHLSSFLAACTLLCASTLPALAEGWKPGKNVKSSSPVAPGAAPTSWHA